MNYQDENHCARDQKELATIKQLLIRIFSSEIDLFARQNVKQTASLETDCAASYRPGLPAVAGPGCQPLQACIPILDTSGRYCYMSDIVTVLTADNILSTENSTCTNQTVIHCKLGLIQLSVSEPIRQG